MDVYKPPQALDSEIHRTRVQLRENCKARRAIAPLAREKLRDPGDLPGTPPSDGSAGFGEKVLHARARDPIAVRRMADRHAVEKTPWHRPRTYHKRHQVSERHRARWRGLNNPIRMRGDWLDTQNASQISVIPDQNLGTFFAAIERALVKIRRIRAVISEREAGRDGKAA